MSATFLQTQLDFIYFLYGLAFILVASVCLTLNRQAKQLLPWHWLGFFGVLHGLHEWADLIPIFLGDHTWMIKISLGLMVASFICLIEFSRSGMRTLTGRSPGVWIYVPLGLLAAAGSFSDIGALGVTCRYAFGLTGGLGSAWTLWKASQGLAAGRRPLALAAGGMVLYALAAGIVVSKASFFPASLINQEVFLRICGLPIQLVRGVIAGIIAMAIWLFSQALLQAKGREDGVPAASPRRSYWLLVIFIIVLITGWGMTEILSRLEREDFAQALSVWAQTAAHSIDPGLLRRLSGNPTDEKLPEYQQLQRQLAGAGKTSWHARGIALLRQRQAGVIFLLDAHLPNVESSTLVPARPGDPYHADPAALSVVAAGRDGVIGPQTAEGGIYYGSYVAIHDPATKKVLAVLVIETGLGAWQKYIVRNRFGGITITLLLSLLVLAIVTVHFRNMDAAQRIAASEMHYRTLYSKLSSVNQSLREAQVQLEADKHALDQFAVVTETDSEGKITYANDMFCKISKFSREELLGKDHRLVKSGLHSKSFWKDFWDTIGQGIIWRGDVCNRAKDGSFYWLDTTVVPILGPGGKPAKYLAIRVPITDRKQTEQRLAAQHAVTRLLAGNPSISEAVPRILQEIGQHPGWEIVAFWRVDPEKQILVCTDFWRSSDKLRKFETLSRETLFRAGEGLPGRVWSSRQPAWISDVTLAENVPRAPLEASAGLHGGLAFPILSNDEVVGVIEAFSWQVLPLDERLLEMLGATGVLIGQFFHRKQVEEAMKLQSAITENMAEGVCLVRASDTMIVYANAKFDDMFGYDAGELIGKSIAAIYGGAEDKNAEQTLSEVIAQLRKTGTWKGEVQNRRKDGSFFWCQANISSFHHSRFGEVWLSVRSDISERKQAEKDMERARDAALESARFKSEFMANMSHEIRTPLNAVLGMTELLVQSDLSTKQREFAGLIEQSGKSLLRIISDILDFSKMESGRFNIEVADMSLHEAVEGVVQMLASSAQAKGVALRCTLAPDIPVLLRGDAGRIGQVLTNLVGNAIKFSEHGDVRIKADLESQTDTTVLVRVMVQDTGIGISEENQERLFQSFSQADASTVRKYGGTGLGLAISKKIVELMGGTIGMRSQLGQGSTFWFTVPFERPVTPSPDVRPDAVPVQAVRPPGDLFVFQPPAASAGSNKSRILLAEDNPANQMLTYYQLERLGYSVDIVSDGRQVLQALAETPYDLVLMDCQMPELDGYQATAEVRKREGVLKHTPIIAMTAHVLKGEEAKCLKAGMDGYVSKPVTLAVLKNLLRRWGGYTEGTDTQATLASRDVTDPVNMSILLETTEGDPAALRYLVSIYLNQTTSRLKDLERAIHAHSPANVKSLAHGLAGSSDCFGAVLLVPTFREMERLGKERQLAKVPDLLVKAMDDFEKVRQFLAVSVNLESASAGGPEDRSDIPS